MHSRGLVPRSRSSLRLVVALAAALAVGVLPGAARSAEPVRMVAADERGVTFRVEAHLAIVRTDDPARFEIRAPGLARTAAPGRPLLPFATALIALPPGARATAAVIGGDPEETRESVRLQVSGKPGFRQDGRVGIIPVSDEVAPIADGPWPAGPVQVGEPFTVRRQRVVAIRVMLARYDEGGARLWLRRAVTVRVTFAGGAGAPALAPSEDRHWDGVLDNAVLNAVQGRRWRSAPPATRVALLPPPGARRAGIAAFDENDPEVRVRIDTTAVYALDYASLAAAGYPASVPIGEVSVHRHEFVEGADPSYVTVELPIEVIDQNGNGIFDGADQILVYAQNWADRANPNAADRSWGDADMVYATRLAGGSGLRMATRPAWRGNGMSPLGSYPWSQRWWKRLNYLTFPGSLTSFMFDPTIDAWTWTDFAAYYDRPDSIAFETNQLDTTRQVQVSLTWMGLRNESHYTWAHVTNGLSQKTSVTDSLFWFGKVPLNTSATLTGSALSEGRTNKVGFWGKTFGSAPDPTTNAGAYFGLTHFDVTYWRRYQALQGYLACTSADGAGEVAMRGSGFSDTTALRVYDVSDPANPVRLAAPQMAVAGGGYAVTFQDSVAGGAPHAYVAFDAPRSPSSYAPVTRRQLYANLSGDYLLIVPEAFLPAAQTLATLRRAEGLNVVVAPLESVNDEFNGGRKADFAIRRFVRYAFDRWNARFVMLMGDGSEDPRNFYGTASTDWVPIHRAPGPVGVYLTDGYAQEAVPSDFWYVWSVDAPDPTPNATVPDLFIGRLPVTNLQQATDEVAKLVAYETVDTTQTWRRRMLMFADDDYSSATTFGGPGGGSNDYCRKSYELVFQQLSEACKAMVVDSAGLGASEVEVMDEYSYLYNVPIFPPGSGQPDTCRQDQAMTQTTARLRVTPALFQRLNDGRLLWNYQGHANENLMAHEFFYLDNDLADDKQNFTNVGKPFLYTGFSCHPNAFARVRELEPGHHPCFTKGMLALPNKGAIGAWASVGFEIIPFNGSDHLNVRMMRSMFANPPHDPYLGDRGARVVLGEALAQTLIDNYAVTAFDFYEQNVGITYTLLGDPATRISIGSPQILVTANGQPVTDGQPVRLSTGGDTLRLEADLVSNVQLASVSLEVTGTTGTTVIPPTDYTLTPTFPDTVTGGRRYHLSYGTTLSSSTLRYTLRTTDRWGVPAKFDVVFAFSTALELDGRPLPENEVVVPDAPLQLLVLSPGPITPLTDLALTVDGLPQTFTAAPARGDTTSRQFLLSWTHAPYGVGTHTVQVSARGTVAGTHTFQVANGLRLANVMSFPNPFDDDLGARFVFILQSSAPADILIRVFTISGRVIMEHQERGMIPGSHEIPWNGRDAEGQILANGTYFYRLIAHSTAGTARYEGRLVKLRRAHHVTEPTAGP